MMGEELRRLDRSLPSPQVGELWCDWVNGGEVVVDCVVVAVGTSDVVLGVIGFKGDVWERDVVVGATIVRNRTFVSRYWRQVT